MRSGFTLIELLISSVLLAMISMTMLELSSQNIHTLETTKATLPYLSSAAVHSSREYKDINDYIRVKDDTDFALDIEKKTKILTESQLTFPAGAAVQYITRQERIITKDGTQSFFRLK